MAVPGGIEELVAKAHDKDVLNHLLAQVVVNTEDLFFFPVGLKGLLEIARALEVLAEGFLDLQPDGNPISAFFVSVHLDGNPTHNDTSDTILGVAVAF
jgi:hypothetical protein